MINIKTGRFTMHGNDQLNTQAQTRDVDAYVYQGGQIMPVNQTAASTPVIQGAREKNYAADTGMPDMNVNGIPHVYLTHDTVRGIMLEKLRYPGKECIIQMPGRRIGNSFFYDRVSDSGPASTHTTAMCEKDHDYCDWLSTRILEYHEFPAEELVVAQLHSHPAAYKRFSPGDGPANLHLAQQYHGVTNGLMWVDPEFHMQFWYIDENGNETPVPYSVDDRAVAEAMPRRSLRSLKREIEQNEERVCGKRSFFSMLRGQTVRDKKEDAEMNIVHTPGRSDSAAAQTAPQAVQPAAAEEEMTAEDMFEKLRPYTVLLPQEYKDSQYEGLLRGYYIPETKTFNVVTEACAQLRSDTRVLGKACKSVLGHHAPEKLAPCIQLCWTADPIAVVPGEEDTNVQVSYYSLHKDVFSRNSGILEPGQMSKAQAVIAGLGSGGFFVALELIKAGIGSIIAADDDVFAYHNICRHVCGIHDVGRYKVDILRERASDINPDCKIYSFRNLIQHVDPKALEELIWKKSIILCCSDNRHCAYVCDELSDKFHIPFIDAGCGPRASTGEVFYRKPDSGMPCYTCAYGEDNGVDHTNEAVRRKFYATEAELEKLSFQPGLSLDIELTAIFQTKLAIDLLMENEEGYVPKLLPYIGQITVLMNYPVDEAVNPYVRMFENPRPMTWQRASVKKDPNCSFCHAG